MRQERRLEAAERRAVPHGRRIVGRPSGAGESLKALLPRLLMEERRRQPPPTLGPDAGPPADPEGHLKSARREWMPTGRMEAEESWGGANGGGGTHGGQLDWWGAQAVGGAAQTEI